MANGLLISPPHLHIVAIENISVLLLKQPLADQGISEQLSPTLRGGVSVPGFQLAVFGHLDLHPWSPPSPQLISQVSSTRDNGLSTLT